MGIVPQEKIRPAIREVDTIEDLQALIRACFDTPEDDADFVRECASEIHWRRKNQEKKANAKA